MPATVPAHEGRAYSVISAESLLTIRVYRGGALARVGHNHVVASHDLAGTVWAPQDLTRAYFELQMPVDRLTVDEGELRAREGPDFPKDVPASAKEGTRHNMLSGALLDAEHYPQIVLRSQQIEVLSPTQLQVQVEITVRGRMQVVTVLVQYSLTESELTASGEFALKQTDLGLTPFSAMMGAMQVLDEMKLRFELRARYFPDSSPSSASAP